jgi:hypothetical protein
MKANQIKRNIVETFIMAEFVNDRLNTQEQVDNMIAVVSKKLSMSRMEAVEFIHNSINKS